MEFKLHAPFSPTGDQPAAIESLVKGLDLNVQAQTLLGVTGSGKTFTAANVIAKANRPTLILSHNKTLAAQLYGEFKQFFPENAVEYFVSYYDYYQPEAYLPTSDTYIEKDLNINEEIEKLRLSATSALLSGRRDVIVVSSVSCIYGMGNPDDFNENIITVQKGEHRSRNAFLLDLVGSLYARTQGDFKRGTFRVKGDTIDVFLAYADYALRIIFFGDEIEEIYTFDPVNGHKLDVFDQLKIYPANIFVTTKETLQNSLYQIGEDMVKQAQYFKDLGMNLEAKRIEDRVSYDLEMLRELGYCSGIENYSRYFDGRKQGDRPFCLIDYFEDDFLLMVDESHVTIPQVRAMYGGDRSRKENLVQYGFRLPSAMDNRPLKFDEFESLIGQAIYISATPADYELKQSEGLLVEQVIRPTGLLDPEIEIRGVETQVDDLLEEVAKRVKLRERVLVTTLTKRMSEELAKYMTELNIHCRYIHSEVDTIERVEILRDLRMGVFDVLIGINLLREGLDLPEVSLVAILDADKEGFLRNHRSLTQTIGRAARNVKGKAILYADKITDSIQKTMDETARRRSIQMAYNKRHGITPQPLQKDKTAILKQTHVVDAPKVMDQIKVELSQKEVQVAEKELSKLTQKELQQRLKLAEKRMKKAAKELDFIQAAQARDEMKEIKELLNN